MKETQLSHCERNFVNKYVAQGKRLDGRALLEPRNVQIHFGAEWGRCMVSLGQTKAMANVSCDIQKPKASRPNEGMLHINVELTPLAAKHFESGRQSEITAFINRQLEKCFKDSKCVDLECLCIVADKKVWNVRVDINIINHDGNILDCAAIATLAALTHFHRPDVTTDGVETVIHSFADKDPLPLTLFHHPICISFVSFEDGTAVLDPSYLEERIAIAQLTMSVNSYRQICSMHCDYIAHTSTVVDVVPNLTPHVAQYGAELIKNIKQSVAFDIEARYNKQLASMRSSFKDCISTDKVTTMISERIPIKLTNWNANDSFMEYAPRSDNSAEITQIMDVEDGSAILIQSNKTAMIGEGGKNTWQSSESSEEENASDVEVIEKPKPTKTKTVIKLELDENSEEETIDTLNDKHLA